jgi:hypothetical protein
VESDLQDCGIDVGDRALLRARKHPWLETRILGLLSNPRARLYRALTPAEKQAV